MKRRFHEDEFHLVRAVSSALGRRSAACDGTMTTLPVCSRDTSVCRAAGVQASLCM
jgi:hypothetical protein